MLYNINVATEINIRYLKYNWSYCCYRRDIMWQIQKFIESDMRIQIWITMKKILYLRQKFLLKGRILSPYCTNVAECTQARA